MGKELKLFQQIVKGYTEMFNMAINHPKDTIVKWEGVEEIEKALKAVDIIRNKNVRITWLRTNLITYNSTASLYGISILTQEEYDLLKEVLL